MGEPLAQQRCFNHARREAVARCPECRRFFCRECITEHDDRVLCTSCLRKLYRPDVSRTARGRFLLRAVACGVGITMLWAAFFFLGQGLLSIPADYHEGAVWEESVRWRE